MRYTRVGVPTYGCLLLFSAATAAAWAGEGAQAPEGKQLTVTRKGGTRFLSLSDWPVTKQNGVVTVAPLEEYLDLKFGQVNDRLAATDQRLDSLEQHLQALAETLQAIERRLRHLEARLDTAEVSDGDTAQGIQAAEGEAEDVR